jgi:hypothetical protein
MRSLETTDRARTIARAFAMMSEAIDEFRHRHAQQLTDAQRESLLDEAVRLDDYSDAFTAEAIAKTLDSLKDDVDNLAAAAEQAAAALAKVKAIEKITGITAAALALGASIAAGDLGGIGSSVKDLVSAVQGPLAANQAKTQGPGASADNT